MSATQLTLIQLVNLVTALAQLPLLYLCRSHQARLKQARHYPMVAMFCNPAHSYPAGQSCDSSGPTPTLVSVSLTSSSAQAGQTLPNGGYVCNPAHSYPNGQSCDSSGPTPTLVGTSIRSIPGVSMSSAQMSSRPGVTVSSAQPSSVPGVTMSSAQASSNPETPISGAQTSPSATFTGVAASVRSPAAVLFAMGIVPMFAW